MCLGDGLQADIALLGPEMETLPCNTTAGTLKCEGCVGGCQLYDTLPLVGLANERAHWDLPPSTRERLGGDYSDVIVYRSHSAALFASVRKSRNSSSSRDATTDKHSVHPTQTDWLPINLTNIPNDDSNINAGTLPDGKIFLLSNAAPHTARDPLTITISDDGLNFSSCRVIQTCHDLLHNR